MVEDLGWIFMNLWISSYGLGLWHTARTTAKFRAPAAMTDGSRSRSMPPLTTNH
ncbi:MAG: hypothetical protein IKK82_07290 [Kiritimatiellae bacterium]|nr:hypothetical protein [Kiritimatiellia bacterium]